MYCEIPRVNCFNVKIDTIIIVEMCTTDRTYLVEANWNPYMFILIHADIQT